MGRELGFHWAESKRTGSINRFIWNAENIVFTLTYFAIAAWNGALYVTGFRFLSLFLSLSLSLSISLALSTRNNNSNTKHKKYFPLFHMYFLSTLCSAPLRFALLHFAIILSHKFEMFGFVYRISRNILLLDIKAFKFCYVHRILPED